jgi:hypothetical protein
MFRCHVPLLGGAVTVFSTVMSKFVALYPIGVLLEEIIRAEEASTKSTRIA